MGKIKEYLKLYQEEDDNSSGEETHGEEAGADDKAAGAEA